VAPENRIPLNPSFWTKKVVLLESLINSSENVGSGTRVCVGMGVGVSIGTSDVSVGVWVTGVLVETANKSRVGISVTVG